MSKVLDYFSLVKFSHTIFALPFALIGYVYALVSTDAKFDWVLLLLILLCMLFARNTAMGFNRWADRKIDAQNPRTSLREIPSGKISARAAMIFVIANATGLIITTLFINNLTLILSPIALLIIMGYSYTKRFTAWSHIVLGTALAIAPVGAYIAVTGSIDVVPILLAGVVLTWVSGFDILYSLQDAQYDREHGLHSIPARFSGMGATWISITLHLITIYGVIVLGLYYGAGSFYWFGSSIFVALLIIQHIAFLPSKLKNIGAIFGIVNGASSIIYAVFTIWDMLDKWQVL